MSALHKCEGCVWSGYHDSACGLNAKFEHEGHWYCKTHHPPSVKAKRVARDAQLAAEADARRATHEKAAAARDEMERRAGLYDELLAACEAAARIFDGGPIRVSQEYVGDLQLIREVIAKATGEAA